MYPLSVVIITFNEERNIARCLNAVKQVADDIVIVDSGSSDKTKEICESFPVNFIENKWNGYSSQKNFANSQAKFDWILSLDADEELSPELIHSIKEAKNKKETAYYKINRLTNYCGKWIKHGGWYPDIKLRIFDRRYSQWEGAIHEYISNEKQQKATLLAGDCFHYSYYSLEEHIAQAKKFSELAAQNLYQQGEKPIPFRILFSPMIKFIKNYILQAGFLDGAYGYQIARISVQAAYWKYSKLKQLSDTNKNNGLPE